MNHKVVLSSACLLMFCSCATNDGGYTTKHEVRSRLIGMSMQEVASTLGAPQNTIEFDGGKQVWSYYSDDDFINGGKCNINITFNGNSVEDAAIAKKDRSWVSFPLGSCTPIIGELD